MASLTLCSQHASHLDRSLEGHVRVLQSGKRPMKLLMPQNTRKLPHRVVGGRNHNLPSSFIVCSANITTRLTYPPTLRARLRPCQWPHHNRKHRNELLSFRISALPWSSSAPTERDHRCFFLSGKRKGPMSPAPARAACPLG